MNPAEPDPTDAVARLTPPVRLGERLVVRYRLPDSSATDVIGWLERLETGILTVRDVRGELVVVPRGLVVVARRVPAAQGGQDPLRTSADDLERISLTGWLADSEPLGRWTLRAGGGFTGRANSCLAVGDPGLPVADAAQAIVDFASGHGIPPRAQVIEGSEAERELRGLGWIDVYVPTDVLVSRLGDLLGTALPDPDVAVSESLDADWWDAYQLSRPNSADERVLRRILVGTQPTAFGARLQDGRICSIGRATVSEDWVGLSAVWTDPAHRRNGWASAVINSLGHWAARRGARNVYLQVAVENDSARRSYQRAGFSWHHRYLYLAPPLSGTPAPAQ